MHKVLQSQNYVTQSDQNVSIPQEHHFIDRAIIDQKLCDYDPYVLLEKQRIPGFTKLNKLHSPPVKHTVIFTQQEPTPIKVEDEPVSCRVSVDQTFECQENIGKAPQEFLDVSDVSSFDIGDFVTSVQQNSPCYGRQIPSSRELQKLKLKASLKQDELYFNNRSELVRTGQSDGRILALMPEDLDQKSKMKVKVFEKFDPTTNKYRYYAKAFTPSIKKNGCEYFPVQNNKGEYERVFRDQSNVRLIQRNFQWQKIMNSDEVWQLVNSEPSKLNRQLREKHDEEAKIQKYSQNVTTIEGTILSQIEQESQVSMAQTQKEPLLKRMYYKHPTTKIQLLEMIKQQQEKVDRVIKGDDPKGVEIVAESPHSVMEEHDNMSNEQSATNVGD